MKEHSNQLAIEQLWKLALYIGDVRVTDKKKEKINFDLHLKEKTKSFVILP